ncbi:MAG: AI-2E family transporter [Myxococcales bacterium]|jgi:predicted PurR-regulated permease PerM
MNRVPSTLNVTQLAHSAPASKAEEREKSRLGWAVWAFAIAACVVLLPLVAPVILAAWVALIVWPLQERATRWIRHRALVAAALTTLLVLALLLPIALSVLSLSTAVADLGPRLVHSQSVTDAWKALGSGGGGLDPRSFNWQKTAQLLKDHGGGAFAAGRALFATLSSVVLGVVLFIAAFYVFLIEGPSARDWLIDRSPLARGQTQRLANVFAEVGRGILIGTGLTALLQGGLAMVGYFVTGVPQALILGMVTVAAALIPSVGAALVWVPVTVGLFASGRTGAGIAMLVIGCVVSTADNLVRPMLARYAELRLHGLVLFMAMLGGIVILGTWGLLFGPLFVRLATEGLTMFKEEREARAA